MPPAPLLSPASPTLVLALLLVLLGVAARVRADTTHANLVWSHPAGSMCPSGPTLESEVETLVGKSVFVSSDQAQVLVRGGVEESAAGARAWFDARNADGTLVGTRELTAPPGACATLRRTVALVLAILLERPGAPADERATPRESRWSGGLALGLLTGSLPRATPGLGPVLAFTLAPHWLIRADAAYWLPYVRRDDTGIGARWSALSGGLSLCPRWSFHSGRLALSACAGALLVALRAAPRGLDDNRTLSRLVAHANLEVGLSVRVRQRAALFVSVGSTLALTRPAFFYDRASGERDELHRPGSIGLITRLGLTIGGS